MTERVDAWAELHAATPPGWWVGSPSYHNERREWVMYAFDASGRAVVESEEAVVREMARCLREIAAGRVPNVRRRRRGTTARLLVIELVVIALVGGLYLVLLSDVRSEIGRFIGERGQP